jgi:adenosylcobinamide-GDP ribazoletransferase
MIERKTPSRPLDAPEPDPSGGDDSIFNAAEAGEILFGWWDDLRVAAEFLTRVPLGASEKKAQGAVAAAMRAFPLVGAALGVAGSVGYWLAVWFGLSPLPSAFLALAAIVILSGAMHEDGLADTVDGLIGGSDKKNRLAIMHDSFIGTYGVLALIFSVGIRVAILASLADPGMVAAALIAAQAVSRAGLPVIVSNMKPARRSGLAVAAGRPSYDRVYASVALGAALSLLFLGPVAGLFALLVAAAVIVAMMALSRHFVGGYTGDILGAAQQACEVAVLLVAAAAL